MFTLNTPIPTAINATIKIIARDERASVAFFFSIVISIPLIKLFVTISFGQMSAIPVINPEQQKRYQRTFPTLFPKLGFPGMPIAGDSLTPYIQCSQYSIKVFKTQFKNTYNYLFSILILPLCGRNKFQLQTVLQSRGSLISHLIYILPENATCGSS